MLGGTTGTLLVDAYSGYNAVADVSSRERAACHAHLRRYFHEALSSAPIAQEAIDLGDRNHFYEAMREVAPGDIVLSFCDTRISAVGVVKSYCYESPKPTEFGAAGSNWGDIGWKVEAAFTELRNRVRPKEFVQQLVGHLPAKYAPIRPNGDGLQSVYLPRSVPSSLP